MKKLIMLAVALFILPGVAFATWGDAVSRGILPYWQADAVWYTMIVIVSGSEDTYDTVYVRFCNRQGNFSSDTYLDAFAMRPGEQLIISTRPGIGYAMLVTASNGYIKFRVQDGGFIHVYALLYNELTSMGCVVPGYNQDYGF